jgi:hypothetical protein
MGSMRNPQQLKTYIYFHWIYDPVIFIIKLSAITIIHYGLAGLILQYHHISQAALLLAPRVTTTPAFYGTPIRQCRQQRFEHKRTFYTNATQIGTFTGGFSRVRSVALPRAEGGLVVCNRGAK